MEPRDVIVLGADIEGLAAAAFLARGGLRVTVIDEHEAAGGVHARHEFHPGHTAPGLLHDTHLVQRDMLTGLELEKHGLVWNPAAPTFAVLASDGRRIDVPRGGAGLTPANGDAPELARWQAFLDRGAPVVAAVLADTPPRAIDPGIGELVRLAKTGLKLRRLGEHDMLEFMRVPAMSAADWMSEHFTDGLLRAGLVAASLTGTVFGPRAPGTAALVLLQRTAGTTSEPSGGPSAIVHALVASCQAAGVELQLGRALTRIRVERGRATGVELDDGEVLAARRVGSALDPKRTMIGLIGAGVLTPHTEDAVTSLRTRGTTAVMLFALSKSPELRDDPERVHFVDSLDQLERVSDGLKYDRLPDDPWLDAKVWSKSVPATAPEGKATVSVHVNGVPPRASWSAKERKDLTQRVLARLESVVPGFGDSLEAHELLMPCDLEERTGATGGHLYHGELALDQLWIQRPSLVLSRYATPVEGLFLCGAGSHPGGPFAGGAGVLGARAILAAARG